MAQDVAADEDACTCRRCGRRGRCRSGRAGRSRWGSRSCARSAVSSSRPSSFQLRFQLVDDARQRPLRFGDGQAAGRDGRAGHAVASARCESCSGRATPCSASMRSIAGMAAPSRSHSRMSCSGVRRMLGLEALDDRAQAGAQPQRALVLDAAVLDAQAVVPLAVALRMPAEVQVEAASPRPAAAARSGRRGSPASTSRNFSTPQSWTRYLMRARLRSARLP